MHTVADLEAQFHGLSSLVPSKFNPDYFGWNELGVPQPTKSVLQEVYVNLSFCASLWQPGQGHKPWEPS